MLAWNARGLTSKRTELYNLIVELDLDIIFVNETFLCNSNKFYLNNYNIIRKDRSTHGGGVAIIIRKSLTHSIFPLPETKSLEATAIKILINNTAHILVSAYKPPNVALCTKELDLIFKTGHRVIIAGDFNCKNKLWNCTRGNSDGNKLNSHCLKSNFLINFPDSPTYFSSRCNPSTLDLVLTKNVPSLSNISSLHALSSDHLPIQFDINGPVEFNVKPVLNYSKANWVKYRKFINENLDLDLPLLTQLDVERSVETLTSVIHNAAASSIPFVQTKQPVPCIPSHILDKISNKNRLRKLWHKTKCSAVKLQVNLLISEIRDELRTFRNESWQNRLRELSTKNNTLWNLTRSLKNKHTSIPPLQKNNGFPALSDREKAQSFADEFSKSFRITSYSTDFHIENKVLKSISYVNSSVPDKTNLTSLAEILCLIKNLKTKKSPGPDNIKNCLIKNLPLKGTVFITRLFNACLTLGHFPREWKRANITPVHKPGKAMNLASSYRPISLLPSLSKLLEKVILSRFLKAHPKTIPEYQFGFKSGYNTTLQLSRLSHVIRSNFNQKQSTGMILLDMEKAFDTVWHNGLIHKLNETETPLYLTKIIKSYLSDRFSSVKLNNELSKSFHVSMGVPQGSVLGPYLFNLYISDIPVPPDCELALYADDTACFTSSRNLNVIQRRLQQALLEITKHYSKWKLKVNKSKTESIVFTQRRKCYPKKELHIQGNKIKWTSQVKYLGVIMDRKLNWSLNTQHLLNKAMKAFLSLYPITNRRSVLNCKNKWTIYTSILRPILLYASYAWSTITKTHAKKFQIFQNKYIKMCYDLPLRTNLRKFHSRENIPTINETVAKWHTKTNSKIGFLRKQSKIFKNLSGTNNGSYLSPLQVALENLGDFTCD